MDRNRQLPAHGILVTCEIQVINNKELGIRLQCCQHPSNLNVLRVDGKPYAEPNEPGGLVVGNLGNSQLIATSNTGSGAPGTNRSAASYWEKMLIRPSVQVPLLTRLKASCSPAGVTTIALPLIPYLGYKFTPRGNDWTYGLASVFLAGLAYKDLLDRDMLT